MRELFKILQSGRFVFQTSPPEKPQGDPALKGERAPDVAPGEVCQIEETPEAKAKREAAEKANAEKESTLDAARQERLKLLDKDGEAKDYVDTFKKAGQFEIMAAWLEAGMRMNAMGMDAEEANFENWITMDPKKFVEFFETQPFFPHGKGRDAFLNGFKKGRLENPSSSDDPDALKYRASNETLFGIRAVLSNYFQIKRTAKVDLIAQAEKSGLGETINGAFKTAMTKFGRADLQEKALMLAAAGLGIALILAHKDSKFCGIEVKKMLWGLGAIWGINKLSGVFTDKTFLQRLDIGRSIDDLQKDHPLKGYAYEKGMDKNQEKFRAFSLMMGMDVKKLYSVYREAARSEDPTEAKKIDIKKLGFFNNEIDPVQAYAVIDDIITLTSLQEGLRIKQERLNNPNLQLKDWNDDAEKARFSAQAVKERAFELRYIVGALGGVNQTLFDVVINEYHTTNWQEAITRGQEAEIPARAAAGLKEGFERAVGATTPYAEKAAEWARDSGRWLYQKGGEWKDYVGKMVITPAGAFLAAQYKNNAKEGVDKFFRDKKAWSHEVYVNTVVDPALAFTVTETDKDSHTKGKATVMGYPVAYEIKERASDNEAVVVVDGVEFVVAESGAGNAAKSAALESKIKATVKDKVEKAHPKLRGKTPEWDSAKKAWIVKDVEVKGNTNIGLPNSKNQSLEVTFDKTGEPQFGINGAEVKNLNDLDNEYLKIKVQERVADILAKKWNLDPSLAKIPVEITKINPETTSTIPYIECTLAGAFDVTLVLTNHKLSEDVDIENFSALKLNASNGGPELINAISGNVWNSKEFQEPFTALQARVDNLDESFSSRFDRVLEGQFGRAITGRSFKKQWFYTLDYLKTEAIWLLEKDLLGQEVSKVGDKYRERITGGVTQKIRQINDALDRLQTDDEKISQLPGMLNDLSVSNYPDTNKEYIKLFNTYRQIVSGYDYEGVDIAQNTPFEIYEFLLMVWGANTKDFALDGSFNSNPTNQDTVKAIIGKVKDKLEKAKREGGGTVTKKSLGIEDKLLTVKFLREWANS